jgi:hypothetical protein
MGLDPLSALGLASNIISLVDFGVRVLAKSRELQQSATGRFVEHQEFHVAADRLRLIQESLDRSHRTISSRHDLSRAELALQEITVECQKISVEFQDALSSFVRQNGQSSWKSFRQAFKALWKKDGIDSMRARLTDQREQLVLHLLVVMRYVKESKSASFLRRPGCNEAVFYPLSRKLRRLTGAGTSFMSIGSSKISRVSHVLLVDLSFRITPAL